MDELNRNKIELRKKDFKVKDRVLTGEYRDGYLGINKFEVVLEDGSTRKVEQITKKGGNGDAVVIFPITKDGKYVMVIESRPNTNEEVEIAFPAGMIDDGEEPIVSAKRELLEETGYESDNLVEMEWHYQDQGCSKAVIHTFLATDCIKVTDNIGEGTEHLDCVLVDIEDIEKYMKDNIISSANSKIAYYEYLLKEKKF